MHQFHHLLFAVLKSSYEILIFHLVDVLGVVGRKLTGFGLGYQHGLYIISRRYAMRGKNQRLIATFVRLKKVISIFLLSAIILQTFMNVGIGVYYHLNKAYIVRQLCENRSNAKMHCNGHCYLSKQLKKAEEKETKSTRCLKEKEELISNTSHAMKLRTPELLLSGRLQATNSFVFLSGTNAPLLKPPIALFA